MNLCPACGATCKVGARFCTRCGGRVADVEDDGRAARPDDIAPPAPPTKHRQPRVRPEIARWEEFKPALQLWCFLLAVNGAAGLSADAVAGLKPWDDVVVTAVVAVLTAAYCWQDRARLGPPLRRGGLDDRTWWHPLLAAVGIWTFMEAYFGLFHHLGGKVIAMSTDLREHHWPVWSMVLLISVMPAVCEELVFRGFLMDRLLRAMSARDAVVVQAAMFAVLHMLPVMFPSHFVLGCILGALRRMTRSIYPGMCLHAAWNGWVLLQELTAN